ncbi:hypothetical protein [Hyphomonas sp.]|uniref:hypothetical protein n=1 Tax=Hyphomonas sp. TaxID=87 RepID=UPI0026298B07|nr:hypothetical protein [Hyphomonas sp.]MDF1807945.1 hypothetical protein [Hyphomonas sp.]
MTLPENRKPLLWKDMPFSERPKAHPPSWEGEAKVSRITVSRLEARVAELEVLLSEAAQDLTEYVDYDYPQKSREQYPDIARRHKRDMDLVFRIRAALKGKDDG